jgi:hypothetical protein
MSCFEATTAPKSSVGELKSTKYRSLYESELTGCDTHTAYSEPGHIDASSRMAHVERHVGRIQNLDFDIEVFIEELVVKDPWFHKTISDAKGEHERHLIESVVFIRMSICMVQTSIWS